MLDGNPLKFLVRIKTAMGMVAILHTWEQNLSLQPDLHCIVPGGGLGENRKRRNLRHDSNFLFLVKALCKVSRAKYCDAIKARLPYGYQQIRQKLYEKAWVVFAKKPFSSPRSVVEYLGRYTHKMFITNQRSKSIADEIVSFIYKDYRQGGQKNLMVLKQGVLVFRFALHILPKRFIKIRYYCFLSSTQKRKKLKRKPQSQPNRKRRKTPLFRKCIGCKTRGLHTILVFYGRKRTPLTSVPAKKQFPVPLINRMGK